MLLHTAGKKRHSRLSRKSTSGTGKDIEGLPGNSYAEVAFPPNLAEALSKTEGALEVLDVYARWIVGLVKGKVSEAVQSGSVEDVGGDLDVEEPEREGGDTIQPEQKVPEAAEEPAARASAVELTSLGEGLARRTTPPPQIALDKGKGREAATKGTSVTRRPRKRVATLTLTPRDLLLLDLNPLSSIDVKYLEAIVKEYASRVEVHHSGESGNDSVDDIKVELGVRRGWRDLVGVVLGF